MFGALCFLIGEEKEENEPIYKYVRKTTTRLLQTQINLKVDSAAGLVDAVSLDERPDCDIEVLVSSRCLLLLLLPFHSADFDVIKQETTHKHTSLSHSAGHLSNTQHNMKLSSIKVLTAALLGSSTAALAKESEERNLSHGWTYYPTAPAVPTAKPTSPCEGNTPDWEDVDGDGCDWYEMMDLPGCPRHGNLYRGARGVADDNCCYCAGTGVRSVSKTCSYLVH